MSTTSLPSEPPVRTPAPASSLTDPDRLRALRRTALLDSPTEEAFDRLTRVATRVLGVPVALVSLVDEDRQFFKSCIGLPEPWATVRETPLSHSICQHTVSTVSPLVVDDAREHPLVRENGAVAELGVVAYLGIPLTTRDGYTLGSFCVIDARPRRWSDAEVAIVADLAASVVTEIELRAEMAEGRREEERQRFLVEAGVVLSASLDYRTTLRSVTRLAVPRVADQCAVDLVEDDRKIVRAAVTYADGRRDSICSGVAAPDWSSPQAPVRAMREGTPVVAFDVDDAWLAAHARSPEHLDALRRFRLRSLVAVPLVARGRTLGAITLSTAESDRRLGPHDLRVIEELARRAALAIDNARLYAQAQKATRAREEILTVVAHELSGPLRAIDRGVAALREATSLGGCGIPGEGHLESIACATDRALLFAHDLVDVTQLDSGHFVVRPRGEEAAPLVDETLALVQPDAADRRVRLEARVPEGLPRVLADGPRIVQALSKLVDNAVRVTPEGGVVTVSAEAAGEEVRFAVADAGPGMSREEVDRAFDRPWCADAEDGRSGLGLAIARGIVTAHRGTIGAERRTEAGSTFFFTLPLADSLPDGAEEGAVTSAALEGGDDRRPGSGGAGSWNPVGSAEERSTRFRDVLGHESAEIPRTAEDVAEHLRTYLASALYVGALHAGDRLPSVRQVSADLEVPFRSVVRAYALLEAEGLVEKRDRSGMYVAEPDGHAGGGLGETAAWMTEMLVGAFTHRIRVPQLRQALHDWTAGVPLRCACVESTTDRLVALSDDVTRYFGIGAASVSASELPVYGPGDRIDPATLPRALREADLLLTTPFLLPRVRPLAARLEKPLVVATLHPGIVAAVEDRLRTGPLIVVCADARFGEELHRLRDGAHRDRVRIVLAEDAAAVAGLDPAEPVVLTRAAQRLIERTDLRLLVPLSPSFSAATARRLAEVVIQLNRAGSQRPHSG